MHERDRILYKPSVELGNRDGVIDGHLYASRDEVEKAAEVC